MMSGNGTLIRAGALLDAGVISLEAAAAAVGVDTERFFDMLTDEVLAQVAAESFRLRTTGTLTEQRSLLTLDRLSAKLLDDANDPELTTGMALRIGDFALRLSGLQDRRQAELKIAGPAATPLVLLDVNNGGVRMALVSPSDTNYARIAKARERDGVDAAFALLDAEKAGQA